MKTENPCARCGIFFPSEAVDVAHIDRETKKRKRNGKLIPPGQIIHFQAFDKEMAKCKLLCAVCHRLETVKERGPSIGPDRFQNVLLQRVINNDKLRRGACIDCKRPVTTETLECFAFNHHDGVQKKANISEMYVGHYTPDEVFEELEKVEMRCMNCSRVACEKKKRVYEAVFTQDDY